MTQSADVRYVQIGGTGRCGTNLVKGILSNHNDIITLPFEHRFFIDPDGIIDFYDGFSSVWSPYMSDKKINRLEKYLLQLNSRNRWDELKNIFIKIFNRFSRNKISPSMYAGWEMKLWFPNYEKHVHELIDKLVTFSYSGYWPGTDSFTYNNVIKFSSHRPKTELAEILGSFLTGLINDLLFCSGKSCFVEDNTWNILFAKEMFELYPDMKLIHIIRDPRDVVASLIKQRWAPSELEDTLVYYTSLMDRWFNVYRSINNDNVLVIKFEDLIFSPKEIVSDIYNFIQIEQVEELYNIDLNKNVIGKWKSQFDKEQKKTINTKIGAIIEKLEYVIE